MLKYLLGTDSGIQGDELGASDEVKPEEVEWQTAAIEGKLDLLVTLDFRMSSTCLFSDIVLPTATWYEKDDMNTSDMHPFIHPLSAAVDPAWEAKATGRSTRISPNPSRRSASAISAKRPMWCWSRCSMTPRRTVAAVRGA
jgi:nitrate reductase alpha subunit